MASIESTILTSTTWPYFLSSPTTPTALSSPTAANACQTLSYHPAVKSSSSTILLACLHICSFSFVPHPLFVRQGRVLGTDGGTKDYQGLQVSCLLFLPRPCTETSMVPAPANGAMKEVRQHCGAS